MDDLQNDREAMAGALHLAWTRLGKTAPNPAVGCAIYNGNLLAAIGMTGLGGRPHAEEVALQHAEAYAKGATVYVTLEPCAQRSAGTPSCASRLIAAQVGRVVIATPDPHPLVAGRGIEMLEAAGIAVTVGVCEDEALRLNRGFFTRIATGRPMVVVAQDDPFAEAAFELRSQETYAQALDRFGAAGINRIWVKPDSMHAYHLSRLNLLVPGLPSSERP